MPHRAPIAMLMYLEIVPRAVGSPSLDVSFALCLRGDLRKPEWKAFSGRNECEMLFGFGKIGWGTQEIYKPYRVDYSKLVLRYIICNRL